MADHEPDVSSSPMLEIRGLRKVYGGTAALAGVDLTVGRGEIHALLGENGAGKSTLVRILAAVDHEDGGSIAIAGEPLSPGRVPREMSDRGVVFIHQDLGLVASMTVAENIALYAGYPLGPWGIEWASTRSRAHDALAKLEVDIDPDALVGELSIADQATVAIVRALALDAKLVVLDEPTASLAAGEARRLLMILNKLRAAGMSCILVTHRLDEVLTHCDRATVLRNGTLVGTRDVSKLSQKDLIEMIVGEQLAALPSKRVVRTDEKPRLEISGFAGPGFGPIDLEVFPGEIVGVTGFADAGHLNFADAVFGAQPHSGGIIRVDGQDYRPRNPSTAIDAGIRLVPSDRQAAGLAMTLTARENLFLNPVHPSTKPMDWNLEHRQAHEWMTAFDVRPLNTEAQISVMSGGNAQKILIARTLAGNPRVLLLCEPTSGVDVGARSMIYAKLREACSAGLSVVMASSDFQEVAEVVDRAVTLCRGTVTAVFDGDEISVAALTGASYGTSTKT